MPTAFEQCDWLTRTPMILKFVLEWLSISIFLNESRRPALKLEIRSGRCSEFPTWRSVTLKRPAGIFLNKKPVIVRDRETKNTIGQYLGRVHSTQPEQRSGQHLGKLPPEPTNSASTESFRKIEMLSHSI